MDTHPIATLFRRLLSDVRRCREDLVYQARPRPGAARTIDPDEAREALRLLDDIERDLEAEVVRLGRARRGA